MEEKTYQTAKGVIHYWVDKKGAPGPALVFLPGLTADHRLFDKQIEFLRENTLSSSGTPLATPPPGPLRWTSP